MCSEMRWCHGRKEPTTRAKPCIERPVEDNLYRNQPVHRERFTSNFRAVLEHQLHTQHGHNNNILVDVDPDNTPAEIGGRLTYAMLASCGYESRRTFVTSS